MQGPISINVGRVSVVEAMKVPVEAERVLIKRVLVDCRGLESALEAVRVSVEAVRVLIEALRCCRGRERLEEVP